MTGRAQLGAQATNGVQNSQPMSLRNGGTLVTLGNYSPTILVQSIGGGGGWTGAVEGRANLGSINASQIAQQNSSDIDIISNGPSLRTNGSNSAGIALQSTAGGGGWVGSVGENLTLGAKNSEAAMNSGNINVLNTSNIWTVGKTSPA